MLTLRDCPWVGAQIAQNVKENAERNSFLMEERNAIQSHFQHLKGRMNKFRAAQAKRLGELTQVCPVECLAGGTLPNTPPRC